MDTFLIACLLLGGACIYTFLHPLGVPAILREAGRLFVELARERSLLLAAATLAVFARPLGSFAIAASVGAAGLWPFVLDQALMLVTHLALALVALRLHRRIVFDDRSPLWTFGCREIRMLIFAAAVWAILDLLRFLPLAAIFGLTRFWPPQTIMPLMGYVQIGISVLGLVLQTLLAMTGPSVSLDDPQPLRRSLKTARWCFIPVATFVILLSGPGFVLNFLAMQAHGLLAPTAANAHLALSLFHIVVSYLATAVCFVIVELTIARMMTKVWLGKYVSPNKTPVV